MSNGLNETKGFDGTDDSEAAGAAGEAEENELAVLWEAVREGEQAAIDEMLVGDEEHPPLPGLHVDIADTDGMTPLHWLTIEGHVGVRSPTTRRPAAQCTSSPCACSNASGGAVAD